MAPQPSLTRRQATERPSGRTGRQRRWLTAIAVRCCNPPPCRFVPALPPPPRQARVLSADFSRPPRAGPAADPGHRLTTEAPRRCLGSAFCPGPAFPGWRWQHRRSRSRPPKLRYGSPAQRFQCVIPRNTRRWEPPRRRPQPVRSHAGLRCRALRLPHRPRRCCQRRPPPRPRSPPRRQRQPSPMCRFIA